MTIQQITTEALALPIAQRVELAQALWESLNVGLPKHSAEEAIRVAQRRDAQMTCGEVIGRSHEDVVASARQSLK